jgi:Arc/MetJ-type ribon-helix-helix transcriptional regulator
MTYQIPPDVNERVEAYLAGGDYASADDVLREAISALDERESDLASIRRGMEDEAAGRMKPARTVLAAARDSLRESV